MNSIFSLLIIPNPITTGLTHASPKYLYFRLHQLLLHMPYLVSIGYGWSNNRFEHFCFNSDHITTQSFSSDSSTAWILWQISLSRSPFKCTPYRLPIDNSKATFYLFSRYCSPLRVTRTENARFLKAELFIFIKL